MVSSSKAGASSVWVVVADKARARIFFAASPNAALEEKEVFLNPEDRVPERDLVTDRPGRAHSSVGNQRSGMSGEVDAKTHEAQMFAKEVAERLAKARANAEFDRLVLVAAPAFLGMLREKLDSQVLRCVTLTLDKDLSHLGARELREHLPKQLG